MDVDEGINYLGKALGLILQHNEGIIVDIDTTGKAICVARHTCNCGCNKETISIFKDVIIPNDSKVAKVGGFVWFHDTKDETLNAQIDDAILKKEIQDLTGEHNERN